MFGWRSIFAGGSLFVAEVALPHEQSLAGGLFNTLTQVTIHSFMQREIRMIVLTSTLPVITG
jgi:hypothetical protein